MITQSSESFEFISQLIFKHLEERDWTGNSPRSLAISVALEAAELLEHFQWSDNPVGNKQDLADEMADIFIYLFEFAQATDINIVEAIQHKLKKAAEKYPAEMFKNKKGDERREAWLNVKLNYQKEGL